MFKLNRALFFGFLVLTASAFGQNGDPSKPGGAGTTRSESIDAFTLPAKNISKKNRRDFAVGRSFFRQNWTAFPSSVKSLEGLGPLFVAQSCIACHDRDGRGNPEPDARGEFRALLFRLSVPGKSVHGGPLPVPAYGDQIQNFALPGVQPEAHPKVEWTEVKGKFDDGTEYTLTRPTYSFTDLAYGELPKDVMVSPRVAPAVFGLGLLEAIAEKDILAQADPEDQDGDGIRGRPNYVWDVFAMKTALGRFGWKANQPHLRQQDISAFLGDMGVTSSKFKNQNCSSVQTACAQALHGKGPEISDKDAEKVHAYMQLLSVPARRPIPSEIEERGSFLMKDLSCVKCHTPRYQTSGQSEFAENRNQWIYPYTDLLLHDMGEELADNRPDFEAGGRDWRTPPLWGIGMVKGINKHTRFLHDGRARSIEEAILWHGGEAAVAQKKYRALSGKDRSILLQYVESL